MRTKINYIDSNDEEKSVFADEVKGTLEVGKNMVLVNTTSLDVKQIISLQHVEE